MTVIERGAMAVIEFGKRPRRSHTFARDRDDFYSEPSWVSERLFAAETVEGLIWDPACGLGAIAEQQAQQAYQSSPVTSSIMATVFSRIF